MGLRFRHVRRSGGLWDQPAFCAQGPEFLETAFFIDAEVIPETAAEIIARVVRRNHVLKVGDFIKGRNTRLERRAEAAREAGGVRPGRDDPRGEYERERRLLKPEFAEVEQTPAVGEQSGAFAERGIADPEMRVGGRGLGCGLPLAFQAEESVERKAEEERGGARMRIERDGADGVQRNAVREIDAADFAATGNRDAVQDSVVRFAEETGNRRQSDLKLSRAKARDQARGIIVDHLVPKAVNVRASVQIGDRTDAGRERVLHASISRGFCEGVKSASRASSRAPFRGDRSSLELLQNRSGRGFPREISRGTHPERFPRRFAFPWRKNPAIPHVMSDHSKAGLTKRLKNRFWSLFPHHAIAPFRFELRLLKVRRRASLVRRRYRGARGLLVNLGAGPHGRPGWVNVDISRERGVNCVYDLRRDLPFEDGAVAGLFCEHVLEHLHRSEEAPRFLRECFRVLEPGGVFRVIVPDGGRYLRAYSQEGWAALDALRGTDAEHRDPWSDGRYRTKMELVNEIFRQNGEHQYAYDAETLIADLREAGFDRVIEQSFGVGQDARLLLDRPSRAAESLYVEALKTAARPNFSTT